MKKVKNFLFCILITFLIISIFIVDGMAVHELRAEQTYNKEKEELKESGKITFTHSGDAGSLTTEKGSYSVALNNGDPNGGDEDQKIVDDDYSALYGVEPLYDDNNVILNENIHVILDHDRGIPPALPAIHDSDILYIKGTDGKITDYTKVAQFTTGNRQTRDLLTDTDHSVLEKSFIEKFGNPDDMIMFITCDGTGRLVTFWKKG